MEEKKNMYRVPGLALAIANYAQLLALEDFQRLQVFPCYVRPEGGPYVTIKFEGGKCWFGRDGK